MINDSKEDKSKKYDKDANEAKAVPENEKTKSGIKQDPPSANQAERSPLLNSENKDRIKEKIQKIDNSMKKSAMKSSFQKMKQEPPQSAVSGKQSAVQSRRDSMSKSSILGKRSAT